MPKRKASSNGYVSKGHRPNVRKDIRKATRREYREDLLRVSLNKMEAWKAGKNPWVTVPNKGADAKKMPRIKVRANQEWGNPNGRYKMADR